MASPRRVWNSRTIFAVLLSGALCGAIFFFLNSGLDRKSSWSGARVDQLTSLDRLALHLSEKYKRSLDQNDFSLFYKPESPRTIILEVRYRESMDQTLLKKIIAAADENARGVARDRFDLMINTRIDSQPVDQETR